LDALDNEMNYLVMAAFKYLEKNTDKTYEDIIDYLKKTLIIKAIEQTHGYNAQNLLNLSSNTFHNYIKKYNYFEFYYRYKNSKKWRRLRRTNARRRCFKMVQSNVE
jgi:hypothetical protein